MIFGIRTLNSYEVRSTFHRQSFNKITLFLGSVNKPGLYFVKSTSLEGKVSTRKLIII
jgi:hypothetical protein